eukprot:1649598-Prymnesium_polylepis.2
MEGQGELLTFLSPIPIVGMSAMTKKFTPEEYTEMGMDDFLQWPVDRSVVDGGERRGEGRVRELRRSARERDRQDGQTDRTDRTEQTDRTDGQTDGQTDR